MRPRGFTLIELSVVLALVAIAATLAAPNLVTYVQRSDGLAMAQQFTQVVSWARTQALTTGQPVTLNVGSDCTWTTQEGGSLVLPQSLTAADKASSYPRAACTSVPATLQFSSSGLVTGTTTLTLPMQTFQVMVSGAVLQQEAA